MHWWFRQSAAARRYQIRQVLGIAAYVAVLVPVTWAAYRQIWPDAPWNWLLATLPAGPILFVVWGIMRYLDEETDEYQRMLLVRGFVGAAGLTLAITTVWGFLQGYDLLPQAPMFWVFVVFCGCLGPANLWVRWRMK